MSAEGKEGLQYLREREFEPHVLHAPVPVLVTFAAEWCAPCKWLKPYLKELAKHGKNAVRIFMLDADNARSLAEKYKVASLPTVLLIEGGREIDRSLGVEPERLRGWVETCLRSEQGSE